MRLDDQEYLRSIIARMRKAETMAEVRAILAEARLVEIERDVGA